MRWRIGLLQDAAAIDRQTARETARDLAKKHKHEVPTVKTEAQSKADEAAAAKAAKDPSEASKQQKKSEPKIRPLSEAKAIESGANFISETFLFGVAAGLIFFESWRSRRKESARRDDVADRLNDLEESENAARMALVELEREVLRLRAKHNMDTTKRILPKEVYEAKEEEAEVATGVLSRIGSLFRSQAAVEDKEAQEAIETNSPGPAEKVLVKADRELAEKRKQREAEIAQQQAQASASKS
jgi:optic atrophy 3 protein